MNPAVNQIWKTKEGHLALIVALAEGEEMPTEFGILWYDDINGEWTVSQLLNRLSKLTNLSFAEFYIRSVPL